jgi:hypothetical protein
VPTEAATRFTPVVRTIDQLHKDVRDSICLETHYLSILEDFIELHFNGDDDEYWGFGVWASGAYYNEPHTIPTIRMRQPLKEKNTSTPRKKVTEDDPTMDSTAASSQVAPSRAAFTTAKPVDVVSQAMDTRFDAEATIPPRDLFGGSVFDDPLFVPRKPTQEEREKDCLWDKEQLANYLQEEANAARIRAKTVDRLSRKKESLKLKTKHHSIDIISRPNKVSGGVHQEYLSAARKLERKQRWDATAVSAVVTPSQTVFPATSREVPVVLTTVVLNLRTALRSM